MIGIHHIHITGLWMPLCDAWSAKVLSVQCVGSGQSGTYVPKWLRAVPFEKLEGGMSYPLKKFHGWVVQRKV